MIVRFGPFSLDREQYELRRGGEVIPCEPQILEVLSYLVEHRDRVVGRDELIDAIWKRRFVTDSAVSRAIKEIRRLLGDTGAESRWIKTVYGRGFTFVGEAELIGMARPKLTATISPAGGIAPLPVPLTRFIGRERELTEATELLGSTRILTLTGAAGAGKSRLALELAERVRDRFPDGLAFVSVAEIREAKLVPGAIALALGITDAAGASAFESLQLHLRSSRLLLVLDNFEQVVGAAPELARLLRAAPGVVALVTSRFVLQVEGEQEYTVLPLALPGKNVEAAAVVQMPAVELFLARARAVQPAFDPDEKDLGYVAEICRRLDGLPLAIELASARIKMFSPRALWERLAARMDLLSSPSRQRGHTYPTLEQALTFSEELLEDEERVFFRRLSVFSGGFPIEAVEQIYGDDVPWSISSEPSSIRVCWRLTELSRASLAFACWKRLGSMRGRVWRGRSSRSSERPTPNGFSPSYVVPGGFSPGAIS